MESLAGRRCFNHPSREAAVRCPGCRRFYCRECVAEHDDMMLCSACIRKSQGKDGPSGGWPARFARAGQSAAAFTIMWLIFYYLGQALLALPSSFHEGTVWRSIFTRAFLKGQ